jgi:pyruvate ferredoxin oxidoreductase delta subunit
MAKKGMAKKEKQEFTPGAVVTEPGSSRKCKTGDWRTFRPKILQEKCIKCYQCWQFCPDSAIKIDEKTGVVSIDYAYCKGCLICVKQCPAKAIMQEVEVK